MHEPIVLLHGLGCGLLIYAQPIHGIIKRFGAEKDIILLTLPWVSMQIISSCPTGRQIALMVRETLHAHGYTKAHIVAHSYGSFVASWCVKHQPQIVSHLTLLDPVCFSTLRLCQQCLGGTFRDPRNLMDAGISWSAFRELFIVFSMSFIHWQDVELFPEECLPGRTLVVLEENDQIVPVQTVRRMLAPYDPEVQVLFLAGYTHGGFMMPTNEGREALEEILDGIARVSNTVGEVT